MKDRQLQPVPPPQSLTPEAQQVVLESLVLGKYKAGEWQFARIKLGKFDGVSSNESVTAGLADAIDQLLPDGAPKEGDIIQVRLSTGSDDDK